MRFGVNPSGGCCVLPGPEICEAPAIDRDKHGRALCGAHGGFPDALARPRWTIKNLNTGEVTTGPATCDHVFPRVYCDRPIAWRYEEMKGDFRLLCEEHAAEFEAMRPGFFQKPRAEGGWGGSRIATPLSRNATDDGR